LRRVPIEATVTPLPTELITPPVTKIYLAIWEIHQIPSSQEKLENSA
jgi:hypothetical protein